VVDVNTVAGIVQPATDKLLKKLWTFDYSAIANQHKNS
jgi:hypothetical protein